MYRSAQLWKHYHRRFNVNQQQNIKLIAAFLLGFLLAFLVFTRPLYHGLHRDGDHEAKYLRDLSRHDSESPTLMILIFSSPRNAKRREAIRETWMNLVRENLADPQTARLRHFFAIGLFGLSSGMVEQLEQEHNTFHDLLLLPQLKDGYSSLTDKLKHSFRMVSLDYSFDYLLKVDDDSFVRLNLLYDSLLEKHSQMLENNRHISLYWGYFSGHATVKKTGKWAETRWFLCDHYLPYALGGGYLLSRMLVDYVAVNWELLETYRSEDVSLGVWLAPLKVYRMHEIRFDTEWNSRGCIDSFLVQHKQTPMDMRTKYESIVEGQGLCGEGEWEQRLAYIYNWNVPPSKCCTRNVSMAN